jgi:hypothetical protein
MTNDHDAPGSFRLSVGEGLALLSLTYAVCVVSFNAGYFSHVPGRYEELFTFTDLFGTNIPVFEFLFSVFTAYLTIWFLTGWLIVPFWGKIRDRVDQLLLLHHRDTILFFAGFAILLAIFFLAKLIINQWPDAPLDVQLAPNVIFQAVLIYLFWLGYKDALFSFRTVAWVITIALLVLSHDFGRKWLRAEIRNPAPIQALQLVNGHCVDRKILRTTSFGFLLFDPTLKQFELRSKDQVKVIYQSRGCARATL